MPITFERATPDDADTLMQIQIRAFHYDSVIYPGVEIGGPPGYDQIESVLSRIRDDEYYKILSDGQIIGGIVIFDKGEGHLHLDLIYLEPEQSNKGIGSQAMHFIEQTYPNTTLWTLDTPQYAIRNHHFYEKFGYIKVGENLEEDGFVLYAYEKRS